MLIELDLPEFRQRFPAFAMEAVFPDLTIDTQWQLATLYVSDSVYACLHASQTLALQLMTAHLLALQQAQACGGAGEGGGASGLTVAATIDKVSVTLAQPPFGTSAWRYWLNLSPYGQQLLALLSARSMGGSYHGGSLTRAAFRGPAGGFPRGWLR